MGGKEEEWRDVCMYEEKMVNERVKEEERVQACAKGFGVSFRNCKYEWEDMMMRRKCGWGGIGA